MLSKRRDKKEGRKTRREIIEGVSLTIFIYFTFSKSADMFYICVEQELARVSGRHCAGRRGQGGAGGCQNGAVVRR